MDNTTENPERRRYIRVKKNFIITYYNKEDPSLKSVVSQLKNIGMGGICIITSRHFEPSTRIGIDLKTPYIAEMIPLEGTVLESQEKVPDIIYETRIAFDELTPQAQSVLKRTIETFSKKGASSGKA